MALVARYGPALRRFARSFVRDEAAADDVVQETWLGVLRGIDRFEGRAALRTWLFQILVNRARTRGRRDDRSVPFSQLADPGPADEPAVPADRFRASDDPYPGHWRDPLGDWGETPESLVLRDEIRALVQREIDALPPAQRAVITLRDVEGWSAEDACNVLGVSDTNQRVLLHRARSRVRRALERHFTGDR